MEERLQRRKLDALKRGVHRMAGAPALPVSTHVVGIGGAGAGAVAAMLRAASPGAPKLSALVVDVGDHDMTELRALAAALPDDAADVTFVDLDVPDEATLLATLGGYPDHLAIEYPRYVWGAGYEPWLEAPVKLPAAGGHAARAVAKAIYGAAYYAGARPMERALRAFAAKVQEARSQAVIAIVFGLGGGAGSGVAVDLARHLSTRMFGRATLVAGVGVAPCDGRRAAAPRRAALRGPERARLPRRRGQEPRRRRVLRRPVRQPVHRRLRGRATAARLAGNARPGADPAPHRRRDRELRDRQLGREPVGDAAAAQLGRRPLDAALGGAHAVGAALGPRARVRRRGRRPGRDRPGPAAPHGPAPELQARVHRDARGRGRA